MRQKILWTCLFGTVIIITGCGGGGGGGGGGGPYPVPNPYLRVEVPYSTPVRQGIIDPLVNLAGTDGNKHAILDTFSADISGTGNEDVLIAGRMTQPTTVAEWGNFRLSLFTWQNGQLVDRTSQWFPNNTNIILGSEPSVIFEDFFKTGRKDLFLSTGTDMQHYGPTFFFRNTGNSFDRQILTTAPIWSHDSAVGDLNGDGFKDILIADYGTNTTIALNNQINSFTVHTQTQSNVVLRGASSVAIGDFLGNGQGQIIATDQWTNKTIDGVTTPSAATKLYSWALDGSNQAVFTELGTLPTPRFELPKWSSNNFGGSHNVRAITHDFNDDNVPDVIIFSRPNFSLIKLSEIQFLKNNGNGNFSDVTDTTLVGYNHNTYSTYRPKFIDLNGDGKTDILVSAADASGNNTSHQFLLKSNDGKYVAAYQNILTDFVTQSAAMQNGDSGTVNVIQGPGGKLYLITTVGFMNANDRQVAVYMSELGTQSITTAQNAINLILQKWPYMTVPQANEVLARSTATYFGGIGIINEEDMFKPIGPLSLATSSGLRPISGFLAGVNLGDGSVIGVDTLGRAYNMNIGSMNVKSFTNSFGFSMAHNDQYNLTSHAEYLINGNVTTVNGMRIGTDWSGRDSSGQGLNKPTQYTVGMPEVYRLGKFSYGVQFTNLNTNPWIAFGGSWGSVNSSAILDNVITYKHQGFSAQASLMHVSTNITPGLITRVNNMTGAWAETGYRFGDAQRQGHLGFYAGIKPVVLSGSVQARLPTSIDNQGNIQYTDKTLLVQNQPTPYVRVMYTNMLSKNTQYRFSAMTTATSGVNQFRIMKELRWNWN